MKTRFFRSFLVSVAIAAASAAQAAVLVVPGAYESTEGAGQNNFPLSLTAGNTQRYQQVFGSGGFSSLTGPFLITEIAFRPSAAQAAFTSTATIQLSLSTTSKAPDGLSTTFAENVGEDPEVVFSGDLAISSAAAGPPAGPKAFDIVITFQTPYLYDPAEGNLLIDFRTSATSGENFFLDAQSTVGDQISRVYSNQAPTAVNATTGTAVTLALITRFTITVPEPSSAALIVLGGMTLLRRRR
ncbi:PEP-CTERM sorting domain-containing protein [Luteolibacter yonseiensis]